MFDTTLSVRWKNARLGLPKLEEPGKGARLDKETFFQKLCNKLASTDINLVKTDVKDFIADPHVLDIWSNDYFLQLADRIKFVEQ